ncbi:MAG: hypothetical protein J2P17_08355, partial [Mycobacterium sp.]|nr:hypothetical protein [Mycobacterium sp.]
MPALSAEPVIRPPWRQDGHDRWADCAQSRLGLSNVAVGTFAAFAVAKAEAGIAFLVSAMT